MVSLLAVRAQDRQAAEELGPWKTHREERRVIEASSAAVTLALEKRALELYP